MDVLVGIPAFRVKGLVRRSINSVIGTPAKVLVIDNAADSDVKETIAEYQDKISVVKNDHNTFCNGAWNQIMQYGLENEFDLVGLGSSDVELHPGWYELLDRRAQSHSKEILMPRHGASSGLSDPENAQVLTGGVAGFFFFLPIEAVRTVYPIPRGLRHWFGDEYIFTKLRREGWETVMLNDMSANHEQSSITSVTPEAYRVIEEDKAEWKKMGGSVVFSQITHLDLRDPFTGMRSRNLK